MRSLVSDLIPEYNKKLQFFSKRHGLCYGPLLCSLHEHVCAISIDLYGKLAYGNCNALLYTLH